MPKKKTEIKALPSQPVWNNLTMNFGFWNANRQNLMRLMGCYQHNDIVHACVDINAKGLVAARPTLMKVVNKGSKTLQQRGMKRLSTQRAKSIKRQWLDRHISRKDIGDDEELVEVTDSPFLDALNNGESGLNFNDLIRLLGIELQVHGIGFLYKEPNQITGEIGYTFLPTYNVSPDRDDEGQLTGWYYSSAYGEVMNKEPLELENVLVFRWPSPSDPLASGDSPLLSALTKIDLSQKFGEWQDWLLNNRARPEGVFIPKLSDGASLSPEQAQRIEKNINDKLRGPGNGRWVTSEYPGAYTPLTFSPTDIAPLAFNEELRKAVLFALGIPEAFSNNDGNRANLEGSLSQWERQSLAPMVVLFETVLNQEAQKYDETLLVVFENVLTEDESFRLETEKFELAKWVAGLQYGGLDNDEFRVKVLGLEPKAESELYEQEPEPEPKPEPVAPVQPQPAPEPPPAPEQPSKALNILALNKEVAKCRLDRATAIAVVANAMGIDEAEAKRLVTYPVRPKAKALPKLVPGSADKLAGTIKRQMDQQRQHYLQQASGNKSLTDGIEVKSAGLPDQFTSIDDWNAEDGYHYKPYLQAEMVKTAQGRQQGLIRAGAEEDAFSVVPEEIDKAADNASLDFAESTNSTTLKSLNDALDELRQAIKDGLENGDPVAVLKSKVEDIFENIDSDRADLIARTEISRATHESQKIVAKASGIVKGFKLVTSPDCCDLCEELDGTEIGLDGKFNEADDYSDTPVPVHPYCRCTMQEILDLGDE